MMLKIEGTLSVASEDDPNPHYQLNYEEDGEPGRIILNAGRGIEISIQGHWIEGHVELGYAPGEGLRGYWYLATGEGAILLHPGMKARFE